ncbi:MAG: type II secretion system F family protein [Limnobacter sp.]|nr:type II secretion system F family protein [Limnobacter sp.]
MNVLNLLHTANDWIQLMEFRSTRETFYEELAASIEYKEQFKTFLVEELRIASARATKNSSRAYALRKMIRKISEGRSFELSEILGEVMPKSDALILSAVDSSPEKHVTLRSLAGAIRSQKEAKAVVMKALFPPLVLIPGVAGFCYVLSTQSLPIIVKIAPPEVWTPFNQAVRSFSEGVSNHSVAIVLTTLGIIIGYAQLLPRWKGPLRGRLEKVSKGKGLLLFPICPFVLPLGLYRDFQLSMLLTSMAVILKSGATLSEAIETLRQNSSPWMKWHLTRVKLHLEAAPTDYIAAFSKGLMSPQMLARLATTIRTRPQFDQVLVELGTKRNVEIQKEIGLTAKNLNTMMLVLCALIVIFLYVGQLSISQTMSEVLDPINKMSAGR